MNKWLPLAGAVLVMAYIAFLSPNELSKSLLSSPAHTKAKTNCALGSKEECKVGNCTGYRVCRASGWSECILPIVCHPGETRPCYVTKCKVGIQVCGSCGQWGPCRKKGEINETT